MIKHLPKVSEQRNLEVTTLSGLKPQADRVPRVARSSQPWALGRNPFGILLRRQALKIRVRCSSPLPLWLRPSIVTDRLSHTLDQHIFGPWRPLLALLS